MTELALLGGKPIRTKSFPAYNTIGEAEKRAALAVLETGNLSQFIGAWHKDFFGGPQVQNFEAAWADFFQSKHAVSVNSATSGLYAAMAACNIGPGDEVIVSPFTMTASAIAPVIFGAVPVFADIDPQIFSLCPKSIETKITTRTKVILVVHIFGQSADMDGIMSLANRHNIKVVEDCAQCPTAKYKGKYAGTIGSCGVYSLNYHKHIHTGEGGMIVTDDDAIAEKLQLSRNHGEAAVEGKGCGHLSNLLGFNFRLPEIESAIGLAQLHKLPELIEARVNNAHYFVDKLGTIEGLTPPFIQPNCDHVYYTMPFKYDAAVFGIHRNSFVDAVKAELPTTILRKTTPLITAGYVEPLYMQPLYQRQTLSCSFNCPRYDGKVSYETGICPTTERMHFHELLTHEFMRPSMTKSDMDDVIAAFHKVCENSHKLKQWEKKIH